MAKTKSLKTIYKSLEPLVAEMAQANLSKDDPFDIALKAALVKNYDFNSYVARLKSKSHSFYLTATLRGICEDIIVLKAVYGLPSNDRAEIVTHYQMSNVYEGVKNQGRFFEEFRDTQPVLGISEADSKQEEEEQRIAEIYARNGIPGNKGGKPSVRQLAKNRDLLVLYDFLYSATSKWVHFSPQILFRMGWGPENKPDATFTFSTKHFAEYYAQFNLIYGAYLFINFHDSFKTYLDFKAEFSGYAEEIRRNIDGIWRWPELVTYEEMNQPAPSPILYATLRVAKEEGLLKKEIAS